MRSIRIYQPGSYQIGQTYTLSPEASHHLSVVLRMQKGAQFILFCGDNQEYTALIEAIHKKNVTFTILNTQTINRESPRNIHLAQGISKGDKMEWVVQKAVELGVTSITPIITTHCAFKFDEARLTKKHQQWQAITIAACEQSGRNQIPIIAKPCTFLEYLQLNQTTLQFILSPESNKRLSDYTLRNGDIRLLIGPEGGFNEIEMQLAKEAKFTPLSLGPRILRTETATIAALTLLQALAGDL